MYICIYIFYLFIYVIVLNLFKVRECQEVFIVKVVNYYCDFFVILILELFGGAMGVFIRGQVGGVEEEDIGFFSVFVVYLIGK